MADRVEAKFDIVVDKIYLGYAVGKIACENDLEVLRHCGPITQDIASWVPDWSAPLAWQPLPVKKLRCYYDVPWRADAIRRIPP
jgi:hypothetical protein